MTTPLSGFETPVYSPVAGGPVLVSPVLGSLGGMQEGIVPGPRSTVELMALLSSLGLSAQAQAQLVAPFPLVGPASYGAGPAGGPSLTVPHSQQGVDIAAASGAQVAAAGAGLAAVAGDMVTVMASDGGSWLYGHLGQVVVADGAHVAVGDVLGTVRGAGDASGALLHFEIRQAGDRAVDPVPYLDRWLAQALQTAKALAARSVSASSLQAVGQGLVPALRGGRAALHRTEAPTPYRTGNQAAGLVVLAAAPLAAGRFWRLRRSRAQEAAA
jgi:murein DD-endopeptidase MepM/ murein hydrolase activator NlpD